MRRKRVPVVRGSALEGNVLVELLDADGNVIKSQRGSNAVTRVGKEWAIRRWAGNRLANPHRQPLKSVNLLLNVANVVRTMTVEAADRTRSDNVIKLVGSYLLTAAGSVTSAQLTGGPAPQDGNYQPITIAFFSLPTAFAGQTGATVRLTWTLRVTYNAASNYDDSEVASVREGSPTGNTRRHLWIPATDVPLVQNALARILFENVATTESLWALTHGAIRMFYPYFAPGEDDTEDEPAGGFNIVQVAGALIDGTFSANTVTLTLDFTFAWDGTGLAAGIRVTNNRWFEMTAGGSALFKTALRWQAGRHDPNANFPRGTSTTYVTGIRMA